MIRIRIRMNPHWVGSLDPDPYETAMVYVAPWIRIRTQIKKTGSESGSALKTIQIHNNGVRRTGNQNTV
jgi:hypothetical protein